MSEITLQNLCYQIYCHMAWLIYFYSSDSESHLQKELCEIKIIDEVSITTKVKALAAKKLFNSKKCCKHIIVFAFVVCCIEKNDSNYRSVGFNACNHNILDSENNE